jgi:hypothetical protein
LTKWYDAAHGMVKKYMDPKEYAARDAAAKVRVIS